MTKQITTKLSISILIISLIAVTIKLPSTQAMGSPVLITEVQTGYFDEQGVEYPKFEFIEIANISAHVVKMVGWKLEYLSAANNGDSPGLTIATLNNQIAVNGHGILVHDGFTATGGPDYSFGAGDTSSSGYLAKSGGHVRLMNGATMIDCVAWGTAVAISGCDKVNIAPGAGYTIQRKIVNGVYDKSAGVSNSNPMTPHGGDLYELTEEPPIPNEPPMIPPSQNEQKDCMSVELSEVLANPSGDDASSEFIELYNPNGQVQSLYGCLLRLSNGKQYEFPNSTSLEAYEYRAFGFSTTGLQLTNNGSAITLITTSHEITITYPEAIDDQSWAYINGIWQATKTPTPNTANKLETQSLDEIGTVLVNNLTPCPSGKYRSLETNRCRNTVESANSLSVCNSDQERNPETGRCRKKVTTASVTNCPIGQERNLVTNRCRKIEIASSTKPCEGGQERNPETGRCRKIAPKSTGKVLAEVTNKKTYHYLIIAGFLLTIFGYAAYEYRHELLNFINKFKKRFLTR